MANVGDQYRFDAPHPLGQMHRIADPDVDDTQPSAEELELGAAGYAPGGSRHPDGPRAALDMPPGQLVTVAGHDDDRDLILVEWSDGDTPRVTSIEPATFAQHFTAQEG